MGKKNPKSVELELDDDPRPYTVYPYTVYLSGPMRGYDQFNFPAFDAAQKELEYQHGWKVISPAQMDRELGFDPTEEGYDFDVEAALKRDFITICRDCSGIVMLPGWEKSTGATAELFIARLVGLDIYEYQDGVAVTVNPESIPTKPPPKNLPVLMNPQEWREVDPTTGGEKGQKIARFDLIPVGPLWEVAKLYGIGARKYEERNWERGYKWSLAFGALLRHAYLFWQGESFDPQDGQHHLASVVFHALGLMEFERTNADLDDRPTNGYPVE